MSYQQSYQASVPYSGSVNVSYPKSEGGGMATAHYSGQVPVNVTININTEPFDGSVHRCANSLDLLTGSVTAMHAAQIAAIQESANSVSRSIIDGFFGTINTELSQQMQALDSAVKATLGLLTEQGKAVSAQKQTLETDYNRIRSRYTALFNDLDAECYKRIYALDKQAFMLAEKIKEPLLTRQARDAALNLLGIEEGAGVQSFLLVSNLNTKTRAVLQTLYEYITQEARLTALVSSLLRGEQATEITPVYMPFLVIEQDALEGGGITREFFIQQNFSDAVQKIIFEAAEKFCNNSEYTKKDTEEYDRVKKEFDTMSESYFAEHNDEKSRRIYQTMTALLNGAEIRDIKGVTA